MSNHEYHRCMSEVYFTRALAWVALMFIAFGLLSGPVGIVIGSADAILAAGYLMRSYFEYRDSR